MTTCNKYYHVVTMLLLDNIDDITVIFKNKNDIFKNKNDIYLKVSQIFYIFLSIICLFFILKYDPRVFSTGFVLFSTFFFSFFFNRLQNIFLKMFC